MSASVDELSCRFVGKNGKKYEIHANITVSTLSLYLLGKKKIRVKDYTYWGSAPSPSLNFYTQGRQRDCPLTFFLVFFVSFFWSERRKLLLPL